MNPKFNINQEVYFINADDNLKIQKGKIKEVKITKVLKLRQQYKIYSKNKKYSGQSLINIFDNFKDCKNRKIEILEDIRDGEIRGINDKLNKEIKDIDLEFETIKLEEKKNEN